MLDRGTITENEVVNILTRRNSKNADLIRLAFENWYDILVPIEGTIEILKELKKLIIIFIIYLIFIYLHLNT